MQLLPLVLDVSINLLWTDRDVRSLNHLRNPTAYGSWLTFQRNPIGLHIVRADNNNTNIVSRGRSTEVVRGRQATILGDSNWTRPIPQKLDFLWNNYNSIRLQA
jgi:hypothetical protein